MMLTFIQTKTKIAKITIKRTVRNIAMLDFKIHNKDTIFKTIWY